VPVETVSRPPTLAVPVIAGSAVVCGAPVAAPASAVKENAQTSAAKSVVRRVLERAAADPTSG